jgi:AraC family ethanolamine operon transcriptional activator
VPDTATPEPGIVSFETHDVDDLVAASVDWSVDYIPLEAERLYSRMVFAFHPLLSLSEEHWNRRLQVRGTTPEGYTIAVVENQGGPRTVYRGVEVGAGDVLVAPAHSETDFLTPGRGSLRLFTLPATALREHLEAYGVREASPVAPLVIRSNPSRTLAMARTHRAMLERLQASPTVLERPTSVQAMQIELLEAFAAAAADRLEVATPANGSTAGLCRAAVRRADDLMHATLDRPLSMAELCRATGISERGLRQGFRDHLGTTPTAHHRTIRLLAAHRSLAQPEHGSARVVDVAFTHGFWHIGRFARYYREQFGELPSETLAVSRR